MSIIEDWMPVEDPAFIGDQVRHDENPLGLSLDPPPAAVAVSFLSTGGFIIVGEG